MLKLTKKADYGLMALKYLAEHPETPALSAKDIADAYGIPAQLLAKILQQLTKSGLLRSTAGICDSVTILDAGRVVETGPAFQVLRHPSNDVTRRLLAYTESPSVKEAIPQHLHFEEVARP